MRYELDEIGSLAQAAHEIGVSGGALRQLRLRRDDFPSPVGEVGGVQLYSIAEVASWWMDDVRPGPDGPWKPS